MKARSAAVMPREPNSMCRCRPARATPNLPSYGRKCSRTWRASSRSSASCNAVRTASPATLSRIYNSRPPVMREQRRICAHWPTASGMVVCWPSAAAATIAAISRVHGAMWCNRCWTPKPVRSVTIPGSIHRPTPGSRRMFSSRMNIKDFDPELQRALDGERGRQEDHIELIASENYTSPRVLEAQGTVLTNKYAEGYPGKRYYGGCEFVDIAEQLAIDRAKQLFGADYANVQPHSGSQANAAVYLVLLSPGDGMLGMSLDHGGHLTHGAKVNFSGKLFRAVQYGIRPDTGEIDYEQVQRLATEHQPRMIIAGFSAYSRIIDWARFAAIAKSVGAYFVVDMAHVAGLVATGHYPNPVPHADVVTSTTHKTLRGPRGGLILARPNDEIAKKLNSLVFPGTQGGPLEHVIAAKAVAFLEALQPEFKEYQRQVVANARALCKRLMARGFPIVSGGTDNHLFLLALTQHSITGKDADAALGRANITVNKNAIPNDPRPPSIASGLRIGSPAATTRGFKEPEVEQVGDLIAEVLEAGGAADVIERVRPQVIELCRRFPVYSS